MKKNNLAAIMLLLVLAGISLLKDEVTPDYRNTPAAIFLAPGSEESRAGTLLTHPSFWAIAVAYSLCFVLLPALIIRFAFGTPQLTRFTCWMHVGLVALLYAAVLVNSSALDVILVSKVNRYLHSPIITLFLWAAFTLSKSKANE